jgi:Dyp-type peroxidase family
MGFDDGISNPDRLQNNIVWTADDDERSLVDGTYMVFQKIYHDLEQWRTLSITEQEKWVGRSKATGLLIGTLSKEDDEKLALDCRSPNPVVKRKARLMLKRLLSEQKDPENKLFDEKESIRLECPVWSHVRKSNPRAEGGLKSRIIYRRGYLFMEDTQGGKVFSGLLFICFQKNITEGFEYIKRNFLNNVNFPVPEIRMNFTKQESAYRHRYGRYTESELAESSEINKLAREWPKQFMELLTEARMENAQNTGREGLAGPSKLGINPTGFFPATLALGGGYYFIPPIPSKNTSEIGQQFFE